MTEIQNRKIGAQPINWSNDDFHELGGETSLEDCLSQMQEIGFKGSELGHKFPKDPEILKSKLNSFNLKLISGWYSTYILSRDEKEEIDEFKKYINLLKFMGCEIVIVAECTGRIYSNPKKSLNFSSEKCDLNSESFDRLSNGLKYLCDLASESNLKVAYHQHLGTCIQSNSEVEELLSRTPDLGIVFDTGHLSGGGIEPFSFLKKYIDRVFHVHLKNIRSDILEKSISYKYSFFKAIKDGIFTVPGDGGIDYKPILNFLDENNYNGWYVIEAEQDPIKANPKEYAQNAWNYLEELWQQK